MPIKKSAKRVMEEVERLLASGKSLDDQLGKYKGVEWLRLGMFFLSYIVPVGDLQRYLSHLAEALLWAALVEAGGEGERFSVIAMGKFGGREITFGSDLDLIFVSETENGIKIATNIIRSITSYTARGVLYEVDTRLRPDGSKGDLVKTLEGYRKYYTEHAQKWEAQALVRARPVAGDEELGREFLRMARTVLAERGSEIVREDITSMRNRIIKDIAREDKGIDVKHGPGGLGEVEFFIQWLQLMGAGQSGGKMVQNTPAAIRRLVNNGELPRPDCRILLAAYDYFRRLQSFLWLNEESIVEPDSSRAHVVARFMGHSSAEEFIKELKKKRASVLKVVGRESA